jgi:DNA topoisomerase VI subunit A
MLFDTSNALDDQKIVFEQNLKKVISLCAELMAQNRSLLTEIELLRKSNATTDVQLNATTTRREKENDEMINSLKNLISEALLEVDQCVQLLENNTNHTTSV